MLDKTRQEKLVNKLDAFDLPKKAASFPLVVCTLETLLKANLPQPNPIIHPILYEGDLVMLYGWRGSGKTWFSLSLAYAIASGNTFLKWPCTGTRRVLFLDGEMRGARLKGRLAMIAKGYISESSQDNADESVLQNLHIFTRDTQAAMVEWPDMGCYEGREAISKMIDRIKPDVVIIDNISAWVRSGKGENDEESWRDVSSFLMTLRSQGRAVILIHHSGKGGQQRGTSKREDILDTVIALKKPDDYDQADGLRVHLEFEKARNLDGGEVTNLEVQLSTEDNAACFIVTENKTDQISIVHELINAKATRNEIVKALGMKNRFQLDRLEKRANELGRGFVLPDARKKRGQND